MLNRAGAAADMGGGRPRCTTSPGTLCEGGACMTDSVLGLSQHCEGPRCGGERFRVDSLTVLIDSLGNYALSALAAADVHTIRIWPDEIDHTARIEICLVEDNWESRARAIKAMAEVREIFIDELAIEYAFGGSGADQSSSTRSRSAVFAA